MAARRKIGALLVLGAVLAGCAPAPKPAAKRVRPATPEEADDKFEPCGGVIRDEGQPDDSTPAQRRERLSSLIQTATQRCGLAAASDGRHGEVRVALSLDKGGLFVTTQPSAGLTEDDELCVKDAARKASQRPDLGWREEIGGELVVTLALGEQPPLFSSPQKYTTQWAAAMRSKSARKRFAAQLPAEVVLTDEDCLSIPVRPAFTQALERWLAEIETPVNELWQPGDDRFRVHHGGLFAGIGRHGNPDTRAYLLGGAAMLFHSKLATDPSRQEICQLPLDAKLRQSLWWRVQGRGNCWVGDVSAIMLHATVDDGREECAHARPDTRPNGPEP